MKVAVSLIAIKAVVLFKSYRNTSNTKLENQCRLCSVISSIKGLFNNLFGETPKTLTNG